MFDLELNSGECEYLTGELAAAEERLSLLSTRARSIVDAAAVVCIRINLHTTLARSDRAVEVALAYLRSVDARWPQHATAEDVQQEYGRLRERLGRGSIEGLLDLPLMTDPDRRATMNVLTVLTSPALFTDLNLFRLLVRPDGDPQPGARQHGRIVPCICMAGRRLRDPLRRLPGRIPLRQTWRGSGREAWPRSVQSPRLSGLRSPCRALDTAPGHEPRPPAACLRGCAGGR